MCGCNNFTEGSSTPAPPPNTPGQAPFSLQTNPGKQYVLGLNTDKTKTTTLFLVDANTGTTRNLTTTAVANKPAVTDDGTTAYFVGTDRKIRRLTLTGTNVNETVVQNQAIWNSVAVSKDGKRLAANTFSIDTSIVVFNLDNGQSKRFKLYNPTKTQDVNGTGVQYADALDFDYTGEFVIYDAYNAIPRGVGDTLSFFDIGLINVWSNTRNNFGNGKVEKLFTDLPEGLSVGNPVFSKNSPAIIAFDLIDDTDPSQTDVHVVSYNIENGDAGGFDPQTLLGYPDFSTDDDAIILDDDATGAGIYGGAIDIDKITAVGNTASLIPKAKWGKWLAQGTRNLNPMEVTNLGNSFCAGANISVPFNATAVFQSDNTFTAQLSDGSGGFDNPVSIGTLTGATSGTIQGKLPANTQSGSGFRVRVVSSKAPAFGFASTGSFAVNATSAKPEIIQDGFKLKSVNPLPSNNTFQWLLEGVAVNGAAGSEFVPSVPGKYSLQITSPCGKVTSEVLSVTTVGVEDELADNLKIYPNPATEALHLEFTSPVTANLQVVNSLGKPVYQNSLVNQTTHRIPVSAYAAGLYILRLDGQGRKTVRKFIVR
jgi:hypothetical protein